MRIFRTSSAEHPQLSKLAGRIFFSLYAVQESLDLGRPGGGAILPSSRGLLWDPLVDGERRARYGEAPRDVAPGGGAAEDGIWHLIQVCDPGSRSPELLKTGPVRLGAGKGGQSAEASQVGQLLLKLLLLKLLLDGRETGQSLEAKLGNTGEDGEA